MPCETMEVGAGGREGGEKGGQQAAKNKTDFCVLFSTSYSEALPVWLFKSDHVFWKENLKYKNMFAIIKS